MSDSICLCPLFYTTCHESHRRLNCDKKLFKGSCLGMSEIDGLANWWRCSLFIKMTQQKFSPCVLYDECCKKYSLAKKLPQQYMRMCMGVTASKKLPVTVTSAGKTCPEAKKALLPLQKILNW